MSTTQTKGLTKSELKEIEFEKIAKIDRELLFQYLTKEGYLWFDNDKGQQIKEVIDYLEDQYYTVIEGDEGAVIDWLENFKVKSFPNAPNNSAKGKVMRNAYKVVDLLDPEPVTIDTDMGLKDDYLQELLTDRLQSLGISKLIQAIEKL